MKKKKKYNRNLINNAGFTLTEMIVAFALLALFMVAATRVISYTVNIYHAAKGSTNGYEVATMISNKVVGMIEEATGPYSTGAAGEVVKEGPSVEAGGKGIKFCDANNRNVTIGINSDNYIEIVYAAVTAGDPANNVGEIKWTFDENAYMGYIVNDISFSSPGAGYPENVVKMTLVLHSDKYGDYVAEYYIKCARVEKIEGI